MKKLIQVAYVCSWCGARSTRGVSMGRPRPGECPRKPQNKDGRLKPHTWVIDRKIYREE